MPTNEKNTVIAFDLYGTLLSTESIAKELAKHFGQDQAEEIAATWRKYQLEYTWRLNSMTSRFLFSGADFIQMKDQYMPFSSVTRRSLDHTLSEHKVTLASTEVGSLMSAYDSLSTFPDVPPALDSINSHPHITAVVFSNGTRQMVTNSVHHSPDLAPYSKVFKDIITVEDVQKFKPHPDVYYHLAEAVGKGREQMGDVWLVSGNPFDIVGAKAVGMKACWLDRGGGGWSDALLQGEKGKPDMTVKELGEVVEGIKKMA
ncbi:MAG: hypothetical protein Q9220_006365 [cf. Caloplaca sp. 1 TL-2023]